MKKIGYIRTYAGNETRLYQTQLLKTYDCQDLRIESAPANTNSNRPILVSLLNELTSGDKLVIASLNIIMYSITHLLEFVQRLDNRGIILVSLEEKIDTSTTFGKNFIENCQTISQMEAKLKTERSILTHTLRRNSHRFGSNGLSEKSKIKAERAAELYKDPSKTINEICTEIGTTRSTLYRYLRYMGLTIAGR